MKGFHLCMGVSSYVCWLNFILTSSKLSVDYSFFDTIIEQFASFNSPPPLSCTRPQEYNAFSKHCVLAENEFSRPVHTKTLETVDLYR